MKQSSRSTKLSAKEISALALTGALMFALKLALASLPNIHMGALLLILAAVFFGWKSMYSAAIYVLLEGLYFGFGIWWVSYLYAWPLLAAAATLLRKNESSLIWAVLAGLFGLLFGAMCAIPYLFVGGGSMALSYWVSGIPFDLLHCAGNFVLTLLLFKPLKKAITAGLAKGR